MLSCEGGSVFSADGDNGVVDGTGIGGVDRCCLGDGGGLIKAMLCGC